MNKKIAETEQDGVRFSLWRREGEQVFTSPIHRRGHTFLL